jgi:hypothetical protein
MCTHFRVVSSVHADRQTEKDVLKGVPHECKSVRLRLGHFIKNLNQEFS